MLHSMNFIPTGLMELLKHWTMEDDGEGDGLTMINIYCSLSVFNEKDVENGEHDEPAE